MGKLSSTCQHGMRNSHWWDEAIQPIAVICGKGSKRNILVVISGLTLFQLCVKTPVVVDTKFTCLILDWRLCLLCKVNSAAAAAACRQHSANRLTGRSKVKSNNEILLLRESPLSFISLSFSFFKQQKDTTHIQDATQSWIYHFPWAVWFLWML